MMSFSEPSISSRERPKLGRDGMGCSMASWAFLTLRCVLVNMCCNRLAVDDVLEKSKSV
jgi:hypothetical protein